MLQSKALREPARPATPLPAPESGERSVLADIELFRDLDRDALTMIEQGSRYRRFSADEHIIDKDSPSTDVFFVLRGLVRVVNYSVSGREITFADIPQGAYFGELSAIDGLPRSAGVMAVTDSMIMSMSRRMFQALLTDYPPLALKVMRKLAQVIRLANERIMDLSTLAAQSRVQAELLRQAQTHRTLCNAGIIEPVPVHSDIASRVSTTRETVARVLNDLARKGIVERTRGALVIRNIRLLQSMVDEVRG